MCTRSRLVPVAVAAPAVRAVRVALAMQTEEAALSWRRMAVLVAEVLQLSPMTAPRLPPQAVAAKIDPSVDMKTAPKIQVDSMAAGKYFSYAAELLKVNPAHITD